MGRRTNLRLAQSKPPPSQGFRGFDRQRQNLGLHRLRAAAHQEISLPITLLIRLRFGHLVNSISGKILSMQSLSDRLSSLERELYVIKALVGGAVVISGLIFAAIKIDWNAIFS